MLGGVAFAAPVTGVVTNRTTGKPSGGDDVVLLRLAQGMQELARAKTDSKGRFSIEVPNDGLHLLRVTHDKANYFKPIQPGTQSVEMDVYTAAAQVDGVTLDADVMRLQTDASGGGLKVVEHFFVKNESSPAKTLMSEHPFELYLPAGATVEGAAAKAPGGMAVQSPLVPEGEPNKYTMIFPIRPGESEFQVSYKIAYKDSFTFKPRPVMATDTIAIMMPKSMTFTAGKGTPYSAVTEELGAQTYVARNAQPSQPLDFTVSGIGELPRDTAAGAAGGPTAGGPGASDAGAAGPGGDPQTPGEASQQMRGDTKPGKGIGNPLDSDGNLEPWAKYKWWIIGGLALVFAAGAGIMLRTPTAPVVAGAGYVPAGPGGLLQVLRDEMFAVETDRLEGRLSEAQYGELKAALDVVLKRALARSGKAAETVQVVPE
ncbi:hypothetical protein AciX9_1615 [Granulicella tundricola MP5ACTX9]|uniref:Carboxypeptidase regulatory-like domain-containing protein n=2 Tax=Granulicella TaxID=940557 RepID=E8WXQ2_GRATM|nr:hypothetical protein AciX9_1615 [Granulicella tundricola MP5ACTX9]